MLQKFIMKLCLINHNYMENTPFHYNVYELTNFTHHSSFGRTMMNVALQLRRGQQLIQHSATTGESCCLK